MASITKYKTGWRAQVARDGIRKSKVFPTKQEARDWAARTEYEIKNGAKVAAELRLGVVFDRYARERSPQKRGVRWEQLKLENFQRDPIAKIRLGNLGPTDLADWRERRLRQVQPATVAREMNLISAVLNTARRDWGLIPESPMKDVSRPQEPPPRERLPTWAELRRLAYVAGPDIATASARSFWAFGFAMRTAMRAGEICALEWRDVNLTKRVARLRMTKNGTARDVPLSSKAIRMLEALPSYADRGNPKVRVLGMKSSQIDANWRKLKKRAVVDGLNFHDSRHHAITALSKRLDVLALARMVGHRDLRQLSDYYNESAEDLARRLG